MNTSETRKNNGAWMKYCWWMLGALLVGLAWWWNTMPELDKPITPWQLVGANKVGDYEDCYKSNFREEKCEKWRIKSKNYPEYWPDEDGSWFKWPDAPQKEVYRWGMSPQRYFDELCRVEAGEFIYERRLNVDAIYLVRPFRDTSHKSPDAHEVEDPISKLDAFNSGPIPWKFLTSIVNGPGNAYPAYKSVVMPPVPLDPKDLIEKKKYPSFFKGYDPKIFEPIPHDAKLKRYSVSYHKEDPIIRHHVDYPTSIPTKYGVVWRGIRRLYDRELGIAGSEVAILDLEKKKILGLKRGFALSSREPYGKPNYWSQFYSCPDYKRLPAPFVPMSNARSGVEVTINLFLVKVAFPGAVFEPLKSSNK